MSMIKKANGLAGLYIKKALKGDLMTQSIKRYKNKFEKYSFIDCECSTKEQLEASIIRLYHTIEKGLAYENYRAGFGRENIEKLIFSLKQYEREYGKDTFVFKTALSCLEEYKRKNLEHGYEDKEIEKWLDDLDGNPNDKGGTVFVKYPDESENMSFERLITTRHSIRHFSDEPVDVELLKEALRLAQFAPSACNRQGWRTRIIANKSKIEKVLKNQNGNRGFGHEIDKLLLITADLRSQQRNRELFQAYIDGGMYAECVLEALFYKGIGSVPLSAALTYEQECNVRKELSIDDAEVLILFVGVGNYPAEGVYTTRSERKPCEIEILN